MFEGINDSSVSWSIWKRKSKTKENRKPLKDYPLTPHDHSEEGRQAQVARIFRMDIYWSTGCGIEKLETTCSTNMGINLIQDI